VTEYTPPGVAAVIVTFKVPVPVPPATTLTITLLKPVSVELFNTAIGPFVVTGEIKVVRVTFPPNPFRLPKVKSEVPKEAVA